MSANSRFSFLSLRAFILFFFFHRVFLGKPFSRYDRHELQDSPPITSDSVDFKISKKSSTNDSELLFVLFSILDPESNFFFFF